LVSVEQRFYLGLDCPLRGGRVDFGQHRHVAPRLSGDHGSVWPGNLDGSTYREEHRTEYKAICFLQNRCCDWRLYLTAIPHWESRGVQPAWGQNSRTDD